MKARAPEICFAISLLGLAPLLTVQCGHLWERLHFQFFPLAWLAFGALVFTRGKLAWATSRNRARFGSVAWGLGLLVGLTAAYRLSPWLAQVAAILCVTGWGVLRLDKTPWLRWLGWTLLLWITLPLPGNLDRQLVSRLQAVSSESAGALLDLIGLVHYRQGNLIEVRAGKLFVDEACSGIDSLYALFAIALVMVLWQRRPLIVGLFTLLSVPAWAWLGNVVRLTLIVWLLDSWHVDLSYGWKHTVVGMAIFVASSAFLFITLGASEFLFKRFSTSAMPREHKAWHLAYNTVVCFPDKAPEIVTEESEYFDSRYEARARAASKTAPARSSANSGKVLSRFMFASVTVVAILIGGLSVRAIARNRNALGLGLPHFELAHVDAAFLETAMPETIKDARRYGFLKQQRSPGNFFGEYSRIWKYRDSKREFALSADFPFRGFHPLWVCYEASGNVVDGEPVVLRVPAGESVNGSNETLVARVKLKDDTGYNAYLWFAIFDSNGRTFEIEPFKIDPKEALLDRLLNPDESAIDEKPVTYQFQLYVQSGSDLTVADLERYLGIYTEALRHAVEQVKRLNSK